ncbi:hypothetical protein ZOSMA_291G00080 [Zostera marina]|uniref:Uncharacterized protein n=1 Tax=Zostera marina TaxID=29655 RepID=A0A0K9PCD7_ZOSMR|nr:hypothetical protein ZOSMA_291G00080 [Zostera marina]
MTVGSFTSYFQQSMCVLIFLSFQVPTSVYFLLSTSPVLHDQNTRRLGFVFSVSEIGKILPIREFRRISLSPICCLEDRIMAMTFGGWADLHLCFLLAFCCKSWLVYSTTIGGRCFQVSTDIS